jgi:hypothetical protein
MSSLAARPGPAGCGDLPGQSQLPRSTVNAISSRKSRTRASVSQLATLGDANVPPRHFRLLTLNQLSLNNNF